MTVVCHLLTAFSPTALDFLCAYFEFGGVLKYRFIIFPCIFFPIVWVSCYMYVFAHLFPVSWRCTGDERSFSHLFFYIDKKVKAHLVPKLCQGVSQRANKSSLPERHWEEEQHWKRRSFSVTFPQMKVKVCLSDSRAAVETNLSVSLWRNIQLNPSGFSHQHSRTSAKHWWVHCPTKTECTNSIFGQSLVQTRIWLVDIWVTVWKYYAIEMCRFR